MLCSVQRIVTILSHPLRIVRELGEASFEPLKFLHLIGTVRYSQQFGIFTRLGAILLGIEHRQAFLRQASLRLAIFKLSRDSSFLMIVNVVRWPR